jgi:hypothetical protein
MGLKSSRQRSMRGSEGRVTVGGHPEIRRNDRRTEGKPALTRTLRSHQLWLTLAYLGLLVLMGRGIAS